MKAQLYVLASEAVTHKTWWNPYLKGALIALSAIGLFIGAVYLLLYTNVGSRLGFLLTVSATTGFIMVLSFAWITAQFPQGPLGDTPHWEVEEVVSDVGESDFDAVHDIATEGHEASSEEVGQIETDLGTALTAEGSPVKRFGSVEDFLALGTRTRGGGRKWPFWWTEKTRYAVVEICPADTPAVPFGEPPAPAECIESEGREFAVLVFDLGSLRQPSFLIFGGSTLLFVLCILALRRYERELAGPVTATEVDAEPAGPAPEPEPEPADA